MTFGLSSRQLGAQVISAKINGQELFYLSPLNSLASPARGGVPVLFPQFAEYGPLVKHGFVRNLPWTCIEDLRSRHCHEQKFELTISPCAESWPYSAELKLESKVDGNSFYQMLTITNSGSNSFEWSGGLHPYFFVDNLLQTRLIGLQSIPYKDRYSLGGYHRIEDFLFFDEEPCEKLFASAPSLKLVTNSTELIITTTGFAQWMVWNPGRKHSNLVDLPEGAWKSFVCIEPVNVSVPCKLEPGEVFTGTLRISLG